MISPEDEAGADHNQHRVFREFTANENFAGPAAAIEFDGAEGAAPGFLETEGAHPNEDGEWNEHGENHEGRTSYSNAEDQQYAAEHFKPRQGGGHEIQREMIVEDAVLAHEFEELDRHHCLGQSHEDEQAADEPANSEGDDVNSLPASVHGWIAPLPRSPVSMGKRWAFHS